MLVKSASNYNYIYMTKKITRQAHPHPLWIFNKTTSKAAHSMNHYLQRVDEQLSWLMKRLTPDMQKALVKKSEKPRYVCQFCGEVFAKGCALGGHISKRHSNAKKEEGSGHRFEQNSSTMTPNLNGECLSQAALQRGLMGVLPAPIVRGTELTIHPLLQDLEIDPNCH